MNQIEQKINLDNHPIYTFFPQIRDIPTRLVKNNILTSVFTPITNFLKAKNANGVLIMDPLGMQIISSLFTPAEMSDMRLLLKEALFSNREAQREMFAIYVVSPADASIKRVAEDFGYDEQPPIQKVKTLQEIKEKRKQASGCFKGDSGYNPYSYRGCFVVTTSALDSNVMEHTGLTNVCPSTKSLNMEFVVQESHFVSLLQPDAFKLLQDFSQHTNYIQQTAKKLNQFFQHIDVQNLNLRVQKFSQNDLCKKLATEFKSLHKKDLKQKSASLFILDRNFDPLSLISFNFNFGPLLVDLLGQNINSEESKIQVNAAKDPLAKESLSLETIKEKSLGFTAVKTKFFLNAENQIEKATKDLIRIKNQSEQIELVHNQQKKVFMTPTEMDKAALQRLIFPQEERLVQLGQMNRQLVKFRVDKTIKLIFDLEKAILSGIGKIEDIFKYLVLDTQVPIVKALVDYSQRVDADKFIVARLVNFLVLIFTHTKQESMLDGLLKAVQKGDIQIDQKELVTAFQSYISKNCNLKMSFQFIINYYAKKLSLNNDLGNFGQVCPTFIELIMRDMDGSQQLIDSMFDSDTKTTKKMKIAAAPQFADGKELAFCKAMLYEESYQSKMVINKQMDEDVQNYKNKDKVFFYIAGGATYSEMVSCFGRSIETGEIGFFCNGNIENPDADVILISDFWAHQNQFLKWITGKE
uniref:Sec1 family protein n=1 Tax=Trepomonas sp. PC1 TaxID=1076344 RepID=A0A146K948_9EUKA|eukprot:JAP92041.1 Sec1 family protein [Trepomonas sp. PC1]